jgi:hypothetical protein
MNEKKFFNNKETFDKYGFDFFKIKSKSFNINTEVKKISFCIPDFKPFPSIESPFKIVDIEIPKNKIIIISYFI